MYNIYDPHIYQIYISKDERHSMNMLYEVLDLSLSHHTVDMSTTSLEQTTRVITLFPRMF